MSAVECRYKTLPPKGTFYVSRFAQKPESAERLLTGVRLLCKTKPREVDAAYGFACRGGTDGDKIMGYFLSDVASPSGKPEVWFFRIAPSDPSGNASALDAMVELLEAVGVHESNR